MTSVIVLNSAIDRYEVLQYSIRVNNVKEISTRMKHISSFVAGKFSMRKI